MATAALAAILRPIYLGRFNSDPESYRKERITVDDNRDGKFLGRTDCSWASEAIYGAPFWA